MYAVFVCTCIAAGVVFLTFAPAMADPAASSDGLASPNALTVENESCRIAFDADHGGLQRIHNRAAGDECLKGGQAGSMPFRIYADLSKEFEIGVNDKFQLVFEDPPGIARTLIQPDRMKVAKVDRSDGLELVYQGENLEIRLHVRLEEHTGASDWSLRITNTGTAPRDLLACFPYLDGVRLGPDPKTNLATAMDQAGLIVPAWERAGGVLGESNQLSMQWHAVWDPATKSALVVIFMDPDALPKRLVLKEPSIALHYFPPITLAPGASCDLPPVRLIVYQGDWRPAARAYRAWYDKAYVHVEPPEWFRQSNGNNGIHFKKAGPGIVSSYTGQVVLDSFRDLPAAQILAPIDNWEYAFFCRTSMLTEGHSFSPHTDGENFIREDMGGAEAMRDGITGIHRLGLHATLYVEGYIIPGEGGLAKAGKNVEWAIMRKDGSITGPYTKQGFYHMCPGCVEWQDHLAQMVARLLRETGADAVRLDSLGFYYWPCYNPAHRHATPFGYNTWIKQLLAKVHDAAVAVKPDVLLLSEGSADWFGPWIHGALTSRCPRDLSPMRLAVGPFRCYVYASGALWGSLSGFPGGDCTGSDVRTLDWHWLCARFPAHEALVWGDVADADPESSDPEIVARRFEGKGYWAVVAGRPACQDSIWPRGTGIADQHRSYTLSIRGIGHSVVDAVACDIETLQWTALDVEHEEDAVQIHLDTNWALVILRQRDGPRLVSFDPLPGVRRGASVPLRLTILNGPTEGRVTVTAPGLDVSPRELPVGGVATITVPADAYKGNYAVSLSGENILGTKRFLVVE